VGKLLQQATLNGAKRTLRIIKYTMCAVQNNPNGAISTFYVAHLAMKENSKYFKIIKMLLFLHLCSPPRHEREFLHNLRAELLQVPVTG
jgi:hypothetical protein